MTEDFNILNVPRFYKGLAHQQKALEYLWAMADGATKRQFLSAWRQADSEESIKVIGWNNASYGLKRKIISVAYELGIEPIWLAAIISFETGGTFSPSIKNVAGSGAAGLIQFMPATAISLGTTVADLANMDAVEQMDWVARYFQPYRGRMHTLRDCYMAVLWPAAVGRGPDFILFKSPSIAYRQNAGLDWNKDGHITAQEAARKVEAQIQKN